jgi:Protein of unknown function (DUF3095)
LLPECEAIEMKSEIERTASQDVRHDNSFYANVPIIIGFRRLMDPTRYLPVPNDWYVGVADVVQSTKAVANHRYKAVNMAGAAVIAAVTNALGGEGFPFIFGGDGARFAVSATQYLAAYAALASTATWVKNELDLSLRVALVPVETIRAKGLDVRVARYAVSENLSYAMFSGGGLAWAERAMKSGEFLVMPAPPDMRPKLDGLSCRFNEMKSARGIVLSLLVLPAPNADPGAFRILVENIVALVDQSPDAGRPVPVDGPGFTWPPPGVNLEAAITSGNRWLRRVKVLSQTALAFLIMKFSIRVGRFDPKIYLQQVVENSDFRKYDDGLRMIIDCTPALADELERKLTFAAGVAFYGMHRQESAIMTCFTRSAISADHVHFIDGAQGGYTAAASAMKAAQPRAA